MIMTKPAISGIAPFFIVRSVPAAMSFYRDRLGFDVTFQGPSDNDIFCGIVERGAAIIMLKAVGVDPVPNYTRDIKRGIARWDAYLYVPDPQAQEPGFYAPAGERLQPAQGGRARVARIRGPGRRRLRVVLRAPSFMRAYVFATIASTRNGLPL